MYVLILFRSLTYAQRGKHALEGEGIYSSLIKAPIGTEGGGCSYALRLPRKKLEKALDILRAANIRFGRVYEQNEAGELQVMTV